MNSGEGSSTQTSAEAEVDEFENWMAVEQKCEQEMLRSVALTEACCRYDKKVEDIKMETEIQEIHNKSMENVCSIVKENAKKQSHLVNNMKKLCLQGIPELLKLKYKMAYDEEEKKLQETMNKFTDIRKEFEKLDIVQQFLKAKTTLKEKQSLLVIAVEKCKNEAEKLNKIRNELEIENQKLIINFSAESLRSMKLEKELRAQEQQKSKNLKANINVKEHIKINNEKKEKIKVNQEPKFQFMKSIAKQNLEHIDLFKIPLFSSMTNKNTATNSEKIELDDGIKIFIHDLKKKPSKTCTKGYPLIKPLHKKELKVENTLYDKSKSTKEEKTKDQVVFPEHSDSGLEKQNTELFSSSENSEDIPSGKKIHIIENILIKPAKGTDDTIMPQQFQNIEKLNEKKVCFNPGENQYLAKESGTFNFICSSNATGLPVNQTGIRKMTAEKEQINSSADLNESNDIMEDLIEFNDTLLQSGKVEIVDLCSATAQTEGEVAGTNVPIILTSDSGKKTAPSTKFFLEKNENIAETANLGELNTINEGNEMLKTKSSPAKLKLNVDKSKNIDENRKAQKSQFELFDLDDMLKESDLLMKSIKRGNPTASNKATGEPQGKMVKVNDSDDFGELFVKLHNKDNSGMVAENEKKPAANLDTSFSFDLDMENSRFNFDTFKRDGFEF